MTEKCRVSMEEFLHDIEQNEPLLRDPEDIYETDDPVVEYACMFTGEIRKIIKEE